MYAVVNSGGKQYKVQKGEILRVEKIAGEVGSPVTFDRVLMFSDGENVDIGRPVVEGVSVTGHIVEQGKAKKVLVFKYKRRKRYRRKKGHRQAFTAVKIDSIEAKGSKSQEKIQPENKEKVVAKKAETEKAAPKKEESKKPAEQKAETQQAAPQKEDAKKPTSKKPETQKAASKATETAKAKTEKAETQQAAPQKEDAKKTTSKKPEAQKAASKATETAKAKTEKAETQKKETDQEGK